MLRPEVHDHGPTPTRDSLDAPTLDQLQAGDPLARRTSALAQLDQAVDTDERIAIWQHVVLPVELELQRRFRTSSGSPFGL